jgi:hypothetical protein
VRDGGASAPSTPPEKGRGVSPHAGRRPRTATNTATTTIIARPGEKFARKATCITAKPTRTSTAAAARPVRGACPQLRDPSVAGGAVAIETS